MSGLRFGVSASTTRGFGVPEFETVGDLIAEVLAGLRNGADNAAVEQSVLARVRALTRRFPIYEDSPQRRKGAKT
jgi:glycine hydroxymethyltransferase